MSAPLRVTLVGCGAMSRGWLKAIQEIGSGVEIVGLADLAEENAIRRRDEFELRNAAVGTDFVEILERTRPDVVFDCTVPEAHHPVGMAALRRGCHVLVEKPLADSMDHARELVRTADEENRILAVIQNRRYESRARRLRRLLGSGELGELTTANADFFIGAHFGGFREHMRHVLLIDMAIHTFDVARFFTGTDPVAVYCKEWNPKGSWYDHDASAICIFEMTDGVVFTYRGSWSSEGCHTTWESNWRFIGTEGSAVWDGADDFRAEKVVGREGFTYPKAPVGLPEPSDEDRVGGHQGLIADFLDCVRTGRSPETSAADNIKSLAMCFAAAESADAGRRVEIRI
jgi:predicted dehydrogenase